MASAPPELSVELGAALGEPAASGASLVQQRPTLGSLPRARRDRAIWMAPAIDLLSAAAALAAIVTQNGAAAFPAILVAPFLFVAISSAIGAYGRIGAATVVSGNEPASLARRLLAAALFAWSAAMLVSLDTGPDTL